MGKTYTGVNIRFPISQLILNGEKIVETRTYPLPKKFEDCDLLLIETPGSVGKFKARAVAIIRFKTSFEYRSKAEFYADSRKHKVTKSSPWAWGEKPKWGWEIESVRVLRSPFQIKNRLGIRYTNNITVP
jgi:hypothetical protein